MGDGCIEERPSGSILYVGMINKPFLEWLDGIFGILSTGVRKRTTAEKSAENARKSGFRPDAKEVDYHDVYSLRTRTLPELNEFRSWYSSGEKKFPKLDLDNEIVKMWYCTDGGIAVSEHGRGSAQIRCRNESDRIRNIKSSFEDVGFSPTITNSKTRLHFSVEETEKLLNWMGSPPPGFTYKWQNRYGDYRDEKEKLFNCLEQSD